MFIYKFFCPPSASVNNPNLKQPLLPTTSDVKLDAIPSKDELEKIRSAVNKINAAIDTQCAPLQIIEDQKSFYHYKSFWKAATITALSTLPTLIPGGKFLKKASNYNNQVEEKILTENVLHCSIYRQLNGELSCDGSYPVGPSSVGCRITEICGTILHDAAQREDISGDNGICGRGCSCDPKDSRTLCDFTYENVAKNNLWGGLLVTAGILTGITMFCVSGYFIKPDETLLEKTLKQLFVEFFKTDLDFLNAVRKLLNMEEGAFSKLSVKQIRDALNKKAGSTFAQLSANDAQRVVVTVAPPSPPPLATVTASNTSPHVVVSVAPTPK